MNKTRIMGLMLAAGTGVGGFFIGRHAPQVALQETAVNDVQQAGVFFRLAQREPQQRPRERWAGEGMGYLESAVPPYSLGIPQMATVASAVSQAEYDVASHKASSQDRRLLTLFQREFLTQLEAGPRGPVPIATLKNDVVKLQATAAGQ